MRWAAAAGRRTTRRRGHTISTVAGGRQPEDHLATLATLNAAGGLEDMLCEVGSNRVVVQGPRHVADGMGCLSVLD
jgi:translation initiation factor 1 (eIF-1/SUI1)